MKFEEIILNVEVTILCVNCKNKLTINLDKIHTETICRCGCLLLKGSSKEYRKISRLIEKTHFYLLKPRRT